MDKAAFYWYLATFGSLVAAGFGAPIPEELPVVLAGAAVGHVDEEMPPPPAASYAAAAQVVGVAAGAPFPGSLPWRSLHQAAAIEPPRSTPVPNTLRWWIMLPVCIFGVVLADCVLYGMGRFWGRRLLDKRWVQTLLPNNKRERIEENFHKYGILVLLFARFLPAIRSPIFIMAGIMHVPFTRFLVADGIYAIPGVSLLFFLAFQFGHKFTQLVERAEGRVEKIKPLLILLAITAVASYLVYHFFRHPVATGDPREEVPLIGEQVAAKIDQPSREEHSAAVSPANPDHNQVRDRQPETKPSERGPGH